MWPRTGTICDGARKTSLIGYSWNSVKFAQTVFKFEDKMKTRIVRRAAILWSGEEQERYRLSYFLGALCWRRSVEDQLGQLSLTRAHIVYRHYHISLLRKRSQTNFLPFQQMREREQHCVYYYYYYTNAYTLRTS